MSNLGDSKAYIKVTDAIIISMENTSPSSLFFPTRNQSQNLDSVWGQNRAAYGGLGKWTITQVIEVQFG